MGALVTLDLPAGAPALSLPWIITFGPLSDDEEWEPVVVGPYERDHALAIAEEIVADEDLMAVVEPLQPHTSIDAIRSEIDAAIAAAENEEDDADLDGDGVEDLEDEADPDDDEVHEARQAPTPEEVRAGMARIAAKFTG